MPEVVHVCEALGIEVGDNGLRLLKHKIYHEVKRRGILLERKEPDEPDESRKVVLPKDPHPDTVLALFKKHGWLHSDEFTKMEAWEPCRVAKREDEGRMPCGVACGRADVLGCYRESFPVHLARQGTPYKAEFMDADEHEAARLTAIHGYS